MEEYQKKSRDNARTPMQWDASPQAGFTTSNEPWMRVNDNYEEINAAAQIGDPGSARGCWQQVLEKRKMYKDIFVYGDFELIDEPNDTVFAYKRKATSGQTALVACNFSSAMVSWKLAWEAKEVLISTNGKTLQDLSGGEIQLEPWEAISII